MNDGKVVLLAAAGRRAAIAELSFVLLLASRRNIRRRDNLIISGKVELKEKVPFGDVGGGPQFFNQFATFADDDSNDFYTFDLERRSNSVRRAGQPAAV